MRFGYVNPELGQDWRIIDPAAVLERMRELNGQAGLLQAAIADDGPPEGPTITGQIAAQGGTSFIAAWARFLGEWHLFYQENQGWFSRFSSSTVRSVENFARRFNALEERFNGFDLSIETGIPTREQIEPAAGRTAILWVGLGVVALFGVVWLVREGRLFYTEASGDIRRFRMSPNVPSPAMAGVGRRRRRGVAGLSMSLLPSTTR